MGFFSWIILGALSGWIASIIMNKNKSMGAIANIVTGVIGASLGGFIASFFGFAKVESFSLYGIAVSVFGAVVLLFLLDVIRGKR